MCLPSGTYGAIHFNVSILLMICTLHTIPQHDGETDTERTSFTLHQFPVVCKAQTKQYWRQLPFKTAKMGKYLHHNGKNLKCYISRVKAV